ncbi:MAG: Nramp family divalent metal transporter [Alcanivoracaceae bacterium]|nr:Nramp family divalent metal transporter [Alcanivoracaceae bacterium]
MKLFKDLGPGVLIAAAFIGPGTVTVCTIAGAKYQFVLLWAMVFSIIATIVLQEMAARLGLIAKMGLAQAVRSEIANPSLKWLAIILIMSAILVGNAAYEAGNISGGVLGLETLMAQSTFALVGLQINYFSLIIGLLAFIVLFIANYKLIEKILVALVVLMSLSFLITAIMTSPNVLAIFKGILIPTVPEGSLFIIVALIGTTVVPYNLFLHASLVQEKWQGAKDLPKARKDTLISIILGGVVSMAIIISAAAIETAEVSSAVDLAKGLEPLFGHHAKYLLAIGLFAAGITSAITAPMAAAYVAAGCFNWQVDMKSHKFRAVWMMVLLLGVIFSSIGFKSIEVIKFAQVANGLLLPFIAAFLLWVMNRKQVLGDYTNTSKQNILGWVIVLITLVLGLKSLAKVFGLI